VSEHGRFLGKGSTFELWLLVEKEVSLESGGK
jgi:hypothetical protein